MPTGSGSACELKAGHPPAVKVGNMRVSQRRQSTSSNHSDKLPPPEEVGAGEKSSSSAGESGAPNVCSFAPKNVVKQDSSGVPEKDIVQSVPEAVKHFHEKPQPVHENRGHCNRPNVIQQPKK